MKISVVIARYSVSGVPLAQIRFARALASRGHQVELVVGYVSSEYVFPSVTGISVHIWSHKRVSGTLFSLMRYLTSVKPDVVFSAEDHLNAVVMLAAIASRSKARISCSSRVTPYDTYSKVPFTKRWVLKQFMRAVMWRADALTCVSSGTVDEYRRVFKSPRHVCVYNIVDDQHSRLKMLEPVDHEWLARKDAPVLVAAGRLAPWKGYSDLIRAMKVLSQRRRVRLMILGDGPLRSELEALVLELGLSDVVSFLGYVDNPLSYFRCADVFTHSAYVESLGNVLVEAMLCGCTPVSTDCPTGPREVLQNGKYGYLVPVRDPDALAAAIQQALDNPISLELLAEAVRPFEESAVIDRHFEVMGLCQKSSI